MKLIIYLFFVSTFFPYLRFFNIGTNSDTQFYSLLFAIIIIFFGLLLEKKINKKVFYFLIYILTVIIILLVMYVYLSDVEFVSYLRGIYGYVTIGLIPYASYLVFRQIEETRIEKIIKLFYWIWVASGVIQIFYPYFLSSWKIRNVITEGRGVISLANEPAYFSLALILMTLILLSIDFNRNTRYMYYTFFVSAVLAQSAVGVIYSVILILIFSVKNLDMKKAISFIVIFSLIVVSMIAFVNYKSETRLAILLSNLIFSPIQIIFSDISLNIRFAHLFLAFKAFFIDYFMPHGVTGWSQYYKSEVIKNPTLFIEPISRLDNSNGRIVTLHGGVFYELGLLCLPIYKFILSIFKEVVNGKKLIIYFLFLGLNGLTISNPIFSFLIGYLIFKGAKSVNVKEKSVFV